MPKHDGIRDRSFIFQVKTKIAHAKKIFQYSESTTVVFFDLFHHERWHCVGPLGRVLGFPNCYYVLRGGIFSPSRLFLSITATSIKKGP
jgi:hypothetical protein